MDRGREADRAKVSLVLIDIPQLRMLLLEHDARIDPETRLVPLTKLYWPIDQGG